jgi:hypothetical protein
MEVMCKKLKRKGIPSNFQEFWGEESHFKIYPKKKKKKKNFDV